MAITKTDIHAAADKLAAEGHAPTLAAIRSALGGGSFTTISEAMKEWKANQQASAAPIREPAPAAIAGRMAEAAAEAWAVALQMANDRLRSEREALDAARLEVEQSKAEAAELADQLAADLEAAQATIEQQRQALASAEAKAGQQAAECAALAQQLAQQADAAHSAAAALAETRGRIEQITGMFNQERGERAAAQKLASAAELSAAVLTAKLESAEKAREKAEKSEAEARAEAQKLGERAAELGAELKAAERRAIEAQDREKAAALMLADAHKQTAKIAEQKSKNKPVSSSLFEKPIDN
jgi:chromosome segregation ATPase